MGNRISGVCVVVKNRVFTRTSCAAIEYLVKCSFAVRRSREMRGLDGEEYYRKKVSVHSHDLYLAVV